MNTKVFDCLIIGGGPAGLVAATYLRRFYREVLIIDSGDSRAKAIPVSHNARLLTFKDAIDIAGRSPVLVDKIRPIRDQPARGSVEAGGVDCGQFVPGRQRGDQVPMNCRQRASRDDQAVVARAREGCYGALNLGRIATTPPLRSGKD